MSTKSRFENSAESYLYTECEKNRGKLTQLTSQVGYKLQEVEERLSELDYQIRMLKVILGEKWTVTNLKMANDSSV